MSVIGVRYAKFVRPLAIALIALLFMPAVGRADDVTPPDPAPARPAIVGFVDTHLHQFANLGFGGLEVWGSPMDPTLDALASIEAARARALPNSDFIYVSNADAADFIMPGGALAISTSSAQSCDSGSCWSQCPPGTGVSGNACWKITIHDSDGSADLLNQLIPNGASSHGVIGYPDMTGWPAWDILTTQQAYWEWLQRAHQHGLKLMVMLAVNNSVLCELAIHRGSYTCGDDPSVERQIQGAKDLETYIDSRSAGGEGFYRIVYNAQQARETIADGNLAVVLGTEVDTEWGCTVGAAGCTAASIDGHVQDYYDMGIRVVYPVHVIDNNFGGSAVYTGLFELDNYIVNHDWFDIVTCGSPIEWRSDIRQFIQDAKGPVEAALIALGIAFVFLGPLAVAIFVAAIEGIAASDPTLRLFVPVLQTLLSDAGPLVGMGATGLAATVAILVMAAPGTVGSAPAGNCNDRGLTAAGTALINSLMDHQMIIDVDHTDTPTFDAILDIAESQGYAGIVAGHTGLIEPALTGSEITAMTGSFNAADSGRHEGNKTNEQVQRIVDVGGFVSLGINAGGRAKIRDYSLTDAVAFDCGKSSQAWAQQYLYATKELGLTAVGIGSDMNGFAGSPAPRYGSKACGADYAGTYDPNRSTGRLNYSTATDYYGAALGQYTFGNRTWDYNVDGFAHAGMYPDFIADLRAVNVSQTELAPLFNGAEGYVRMWEKIDDNEAPTVRCGTVGENWHAADVTVPCLAFDQGWGLGDAADANFSLSTSVPDGTETGDAFTGGHAAICDSKPVGQHCTDPVPAITGINVDKKDPTVVVTTPPAGTPTYLLNQAVTADYECADGGSGVKSCAGPVADDAAIDTTIGSHNFTVTGVDNVDHTVSVAHPYNVSFAICVLYDQTRAHRAGSTVPIRLGLCDATGANVSSASIVVTATAVTQVSTMATGLPEDAGSANPDDAFRFYPGLGAYIFNLQTTGLATGTYALSFTATGDPITHTVQFQIR